MDIKELRDKARRLTELPGVYLMQDKGKNIIYIGKAKNLRNRVSGYFGTGNDHTEKTRKMVEQVYDFDYIVTAGEFEALVLECSLIKQHTPKYNILLKDSKGYHYIKITKEDYPRVSKARKITDDAEYIGPFVSSFAVTETVENTNTVFKLPSCSRKFPRDFRKERPCLNYHIKKCAGICRGNITKEDYSTIIIQAKEYMKTGSAQSVERLTKAMEQAAENLDFERAAILRDRIDAIKKVSETQKVFLKKQYEIDAIAAAKTEKTLCIVLIRFRNGQLNDKSHYIFENADDFDYIRQEFYFRYYSAAPDYPRQVYLDAEPSEPLLLKQLIESVSNHKTELIVPQKGEGAALVSMAMENAVEQLANLQGRTGREIKALDELSGLLGLSAPPKIIEAYDISNLGDSGIVGGMTVFNQGKPQKDAYKKFMIKTVAVRDDYGSMREVLERRFRHYIDPEEKDEGFKTLPELILIDGGKGHVTAARSVLQGFGIDVPVFGMVKDQKHRTRAIARDGGEIAISGYKSAFMLITRIQDETHRFTIAYQRKKRKFSGLEQELMKIQGIGAKKAAALIKKYKTRSIMNAAPVDDIAKTAAVSEEKAREILLILRETAVK